MIEIAQTPIDPPRPRLWNPNAAACWSLLFTPVFGAWLHAANWKTLDRPDKARASMGWVWATAGYLVVNVGSLFLPDSQLLDRVFQLAGLGVLLGWYFAIGREQVRFVTGTIGPDYVRRSWGRPIAVAATASAAYAALVVGIAYAVYDPSPAEIADTIRPVLLAEWHKQPGFEDATIQSIELTRTNDGGYAGWIDATFKGVPTRMPLTARVRDGMIEWDLKPHDGEK